ncbi:MAG: D-alanine--D-alanine ligase [Saprospiraceae bacterium]
MNYLQQKIHRLLHWEYWPYAAVYYPILPIWLYYSLKARSLFFFNAANPTIKNGGMAMESKKEIYDLIPAKFIPKTILAGSNECIEVIFKRTLDAGISFPMIAKPDIGMKGLGVSEIQDVQQLADYQKKIDKDFLLQELITYPNEIGIFYVRIPGEKIGKITGIVSKVFLTVTGNGKDTIVDLIKQKPRSSFQLPGLKRTYGDYLNTVLPPGEKFILVPFGSHTRGSMFLDATAMLNGKLLQTMDKVCNEVPGFYFGRLDIRFTTYEELSEGKNFSIIEINGAGSEPTHMYDPAHSIFFGWKEIVRHWKLLYQISLANNKKGHPYLSYSAGIEMVRANIVLEAELRML